MNFRWNEWNVEHLERHGVAPEMAEMAEEVVERAAGRYPRRIDGDKLLVWGRTEEGLALQVIFVVDDDGTAFVLHARPLTEREKRRYQRHS